MKKLGYYLFLFIGLSLSNSVKSQCPLDIGQTPILNDNGLILYFPFNNNVQNFGDSNYTATLSGATYTNGICGQSLQFDGFNDYVEVNPYMQMNGNITIATWIYLDSLTYEQEIFTTREQCQNTYRRHSQAEFVINYNAPPSSLQLHRILYMANTHQSCAGYSTGDRYEPLNITYTTGHWYFIAVTIQNSNFENRTVDFYINCQHISADFFQDVPTASLFTANYIYKTYIGGGPNVGTYSYTIDGKIDEFRLYNRILTDEELLNLYYKCKPLDITINQFIGNCTGDSANIELENTQDGVSYQLFDSTNQQNIGLSQYGGCNNLVFSTGLVTTPTIFYIKASHSNCQIPLDTLISLNPTVGGSNNYDTISVCTGNSIFIHGNYYSPPNLVIDTLIDVNGCDSIINTTLLAIPLPQVDLGADTSLCNGDSILLSVQNSYNSILWSNGSSQNSIWIDTVGTYWVKISDSLCNNSDTIIVSDLQSSYLSINDTILCSGKSWKITLPINNQYLWWNNNVSNSVFVSDSGNYWVKITDNCKTYIDSFTVALNDCNGCMIFIPNVFTPNEDGLNDVFFAVIKCDLKQYEMLIFNRWGKLIFESTNQNKKWTGKYKGEDLPDGVYFYRMNFLQNKEGAKMDYKVGSITLYR